MYRGRSPGATGGRNDHPPDVLFVTSDWSYTGAFVLQLGPATDIEAGKLEGRVEHVASTRSARFGTLDELLTALREILADASRTAPGGDRKT